MDKLFEYWVEYWASKFAKMIGANYFSDINNNSRIRFFNICNWKSLKQLRPDVVIEKDSKVLILEIKYKKHLVYLQFAQKSPEILEEHRHDLHQLLAYLSTTQKDRRIGCLIYPNLNGKPIFQFATLINYQNVKPKVDIVLCGVPFSNDTLLDILKFIWNKT